MEFLHDTMILLPCEQVGKSGRGKKMPAAPEPPADVRTFMEELRNQTSYEISSEVTKQLSLTYLCSCPFAHLNDSEMTVSRHLEEQPILISTAHLLLAAHEKTGLANLIILLPGMTTDASMEADQISTGRLYLDYDGTHDFYSLAHLAGEKLGLHLLDTPRAIIAMDRAGRSLEQLTPQELEYYESLILGEAYDSKVVDYRIESRHAKESLSRNLHQYSYYDLYASSKILLLRLNDFSGQFSKNIRNEVSVLFVCNLIFLQNAAVVQANQRIVHTLSKQEVLTLKQIETMHIHFGSTMFLRERNVFRYVLVNQLAEAIEEAVESEKLMERYRLNQEHLEHIVNLKASRTAERESKIINAVASIK